MWPNTSLEPTGVGAGSSAARFTSRAAGGSVLGRQATSRVKTLIIFFVGLLLGLAGGSVLTFRHADHEVAAVVMQMMQPVEASDRLEAARGIRAIQLIEASNTNQAIEMFSFPIASFYTEYRGLTHNEKRTQDLVAEIEKFAETNQVVAARIKAEMSYGRTNTEVR